METRGNGIGRRRLAKVTIAPSVFPFVFRFVSFPAATYDHVIERKRWLAVVNFVKEWKVRSTGFDLIMNAFDLVCYYTILAFIYIYIYYRLRYNLFVLLNSMGKGCLRLRPSHRKIH